MQTDNNIQRIVSLGTTWAAFGLKVGAEALTRTAKVLETLAEGFEPNKHQPAAEEQPKPQQPE